MTHPAKVRLPLLAIVAAAIALIIARMVWPRLHFDTTSLILFGIAAVAWALATVPVTRVKFGDFEAELAPVVAAFEQKVIAAEAAQAVQAAAPRTPRPGEVMRGPAVANPAVAAALEEYRSIVASTAPDLDKVVQAASLVERLSHDGRMDSSDREAVRLLLVIRDHVMRKPGTLQPHITTGVLDTVGRLIRTMA